MNIKIRSKVMCRDDTTGIEPKGTVKIKKQNGNA